MCVSSETWAWPVKKVNELTLHRAEMRMIRWMCGVKVIDKFVCILTEREARPDQTPTLRGTGNEYHPKCGDALRLGSKGRYGSFHLCINVWVAGKLCDPSLTRAIPEHFRDES